MIVMKLRTYLSNFATKATFHSKQNIDSKFIGKLKIKLQVFVIHILIVASLKLCIESSKLYQT